MTDNDDREPTSLAAVADSVDRPLTEREQAFVNDEGALRAGTPRWHAWRAEATGWPETFKLMRRTVDPLMGKDGSGTEVAATGAVFPDGTAALSWAGGSVAVWPSIELLIQRHVAGSMSGSTWVEWASAPEAQEDGQPTLEVPRVGRRGWLEVADGMWRFHLPGDLSASILETTDGFAASIGTGTVCLRGGQVFDTLERAITWIEDQLVVALAGS
jgi:hypothetical protein